MANQNPEQIARDNIDKQLTACGWIIQSIKQVNLNSGLGIAVKEYFTDVGPVDYLLFVEGKPCGIIEAKREEEGHRINVHENQGEEYAHAKLKHLKNDPLPFVYISTGRPAVVITETADQFKDIVIAAISSVVPSALNKNEIHINPSKTNNLRVQSVIKVDRIVTLKQGDKIADLGRLNSKEMSEFSKVF